MAKKLVMFDGQKTVSLWGGAEDGWIISGAETSGEIPDYFRNVAWLYRAVIIRSNEVAAMPFVIYKGEKEFDTSANWQNKVGFMPNPTKLLQLIEASLFLAGKSYLWREKNVLMTKGIRYKLPSAFKPVIDETKGLTGFERWTGKRWVPAEVDEVVYFWLADPYVEIGEPTAFPAKAAMQASGSMYDMQEFVDNFFKRGAIKTTIFEAESMPAAERERFESWWQKFVGGVRNAWKTFIINSRGMKAIVIGEGMKELENQTFTREAKESIATAAGIPFSVLFSDAANYATAEVDERAWYKKTIIPECEFIASIFNEQVFEPMGLHMEFTPESLEIFQEDENERSGSLAQYVNIGFELLDACDLLGIDLPIEMRAKYEAKQVEKQEMAETLQQNLAGAAEEPQNAPTSPQEALGDEEDDETVKYAGDLDKWRRKALNALKRSKSPAVSFESVLIPANVYQNVSAALAQAKDENAVRSAFVTSPAVVTISQAAAPEDTIDWDILRDAIKALQEPTVVTQEAPV